MRSNDYSLCNVIFLNLKRIVYLDFISQSITRTARLTHARRRSTSKFTSAYLHAHVYRVSPSSWSITRPTSVERVFCAPSKDIRVESSSPHRAQKCRIGSFRLYDAYRCKPSKQLTESRFCLRFTRGSCLFSPSSTVNSLSVFFFFASWRFFFARGILNTRNFPHGHAN